MRCDAARRRRRCDAATTMVRCRHKETRCDAAKKMYGGAMPSLDLVRCQRRGWCDAIVMMESWCEANKYCGAMPQDDDGVMISIAKAWSTSSGGRCMRHDAMVTGATMASSTTRWSMAGGWRCDGVVYDKMVRGGDRHCDDVMHSMYCIVMASSSC